MGHRLDAKYAFAFGVDLQGQSPAEQFEDRQIVHRCLDRDFPRGGLATSFAVSGMLEERGGMPTQLDRKRLAEFVQEWSAAGCGSRSPVVEQEGFEDGSRA